MHQNLNTILLIDDDNTTNYLHRKIISKSDIDIPILVANNGKEGMDELIALNEILKEKEDLLLIFLDVNMPVMDGWTFLEYFKEIEPKLNYSTQLFMVSSSINPDDKNRALKNSFVLDYLSKPLNVSLIKKLLE